MRLDQLLDVSYKRLLMYLLKEIKQAVVSLEFQTKRNRETWHRQRTLKKGEKKGKQGKENGEPDNDGCERSNKFK